MSFITFMEILNLSKGFSADMFQKTSRSSLSHHQSGYQEEWILASYCSLHWLVSWWQKFLHSFGSLSLDNIYLLPGAEQSLLKNNSDMCDTADECHNFTLLHLNAWMLKRSLHIFILFNFHPFILSHFDTVCESPAVTFMQSYQENYIPEWLPVIQHLKHAPQTTLSRKFHTRTTSSYTFERHSPNK